MKELYKNKFSEKLKELRIEQGKTQQDVAKYVGIPTSTYANYEQGLNEAPYDVLIALSIFFNTTVDFLLGIDEL